MAKNQHVIPYEGKWAVQSEGHKKLSSVFDTKQEAIDKARELARISGTEIRIHGRNGQIFHSSDAPKPG